MSLGIPAIQTRYHGCHFRSRLEARWAVFFDTLDVKWEYEKQGYALEAGWGPYLPDFYFPDTGCWMEIKPEIPDDHWKMLESEIKMMWLCRGTLSKGVVVFGLPDVKKCPFSWFDYSPQEDFQFGLNRSVGLYSLFLCFPVCFKPGSMAMACEAATSARFEFGETPEVPTL